MNFISFNRFDRIILGLVFIGIIAVGVGTILTNMGSERNYRTILETQAADNIRGNITQSNLNNQLKSIDSTVTLIPSINDTLININQTLDEIRNLAPQSNLTAQTEAIKKVESNVESLERIERALNITSEGLINNNNSSVP